MAIRKAGPTRDQRAAIIKRYLKPDQNIEWGREMIAFAALWKQYPSLAFWTHHEIPFALNHMSFFQTVEGAAMLESDWTVFHWNPPAPDAEQPPSEARLDTAPQPAYHEPYKPTPVRPRTVAEFLKTP